ncbi:hypothetical protein D770_19830 [Flammeovirgaceae bacterium 311]|nr:hypothetical protein D770_19830 [Flammeovirgaceae bacterium 311]
MEYTLKEVSDAPIAYGLPKATANAAGRKESFLSGFVRFSWFILFLFSILQLGIFWSLDNAIAVVTVAFAWLVLTKFILRSGVLATYPISGFLIIGFTLTQFYFPLLFTLLEGKPIIHNMDLPIEVFMHSSAALIVLVAAHLVYRSFERTNRNRPRSLLVKAGFFIPPNDRQLWIMGFLGLASMFYVYFYSPSVGREVSGAGDKFIQGLIAFSYAPFFIPFRRLYGKKEGNLKRIIPLLVIFTILLFAVSLGRNSRGAFMLGFTSVGFTFGLGLLLGIIRTRLFTVRNVFIAAMGLWFFTGPLADIATAMVLVRGLRDDIPRTELIALTLEAYQDKEAIRLYRLAGITQEREWDEQYMDNLFLARFSNLKYNDASLVEASKLCEIDPSLFDFTIDRFWATLPQPAINVLGLNLDKSVVTSYSFGDYLHYKAGAGPGALGGFRTGHFAGTGMAAFGYWYLLLLGVGMLPVYWMFDKLKILKRSDESAGNTKEPLFSFCGLLGLTTAFRFLPAESVIEPFEFLLRGFLQMLLLYFLVFHITRYLSILLPGIVSTRVVRRSRFTAP